MYRQKDLDTTVRHIPKFVGEIWYVDKVNGSDSNTGKKPDRAFETIGQAISSCSAGDAITISAGTYTETGLDVNKNAVELWMEIGVILDSASGTGLTVSGDYCRMSGGISITPTAGEVGLLISGSYCRIGDVGGPTIIGGATGIQITGTGTVIRLGACGQQTTTGYDIQGAQTRLYECSTAGAGATIGYHINSGVDTGILKDCTSSGHTTSGFTIDTGSSGWSIVGCSSGAGDGSFSDADHVNVWSNYTFSDKISKEINIAQAGAGTWEYNIFKVTGTVLIHSIYGIVETALTGSNTVCYLDIYSANGEEVITKATGVTLGTAVVGSFVGRIDDDGTALAFHDATGSAGMIDAVAANNQSFRLIEDRTGGTHVDTYIRFIHTTAAASTGLIDWYVKWSPISDDGFLAAV